MTKPVIASSILRSRIDSMGLMENSDGSFKRGRRVYNRHAILLIATEDNALQRSKLMERLKSIVVADKVV